MKLENKDQKQLKAHLWRLAKEYNRKKDADWRGYTSCITCGKMGEYKEFDTGHFIHGNSKMSWVEPSNLHAQCRGCNSYRGGQGRLYERYMQQRYGMDEVLRLEKKAKESTTWNKKLLMEWIEKYNELL